VSKADSLRLLILSACINCAHCRGIDVDFFVDCDRYIEGKCRIYCKFFERRSEEAKGGEPK